MGNFTGQHRTFIKDVPFSQASNLEGLIVSSDQNKYIKMSGGIEAGSNAITTNESLPIVSLSNVVTDKKCFGVISASEDPENRTEQYGAFGTNFEKEKGDTRVYINSVGEGAIWVVNTNGSLESGDYITTSNVAGYGQKQESEFLANYTVAKITMDCDFEPMTQPIQIIKTHETGENVLDEHDQIQWEDHPTETEKAYKLRYLTIDGTQTDEANAVHTEPSSRRIVENPVWTEDLSNKYNFPPKCNPLCKKDIPIEVRRTSLVSNKVLRTFSFKKTSLHNRYVAGTDDRKPRDSLCERGHIRRFIEYHGRYDHRTDPDERHPA